MPITKDTLDFLFENRLHDSREWYNAHKPEFQQKVLTPLAELVRELAPTVWDIDPLLIAEPKVDRSISRVYRDTRFSKDKSLYRENMWIVFNRDKKQYPCPPGFVFEFSPDGFRYGCGYYDIPPKLMESIRAQVLKGSPAFRAAQAAYEGQERFTLEGDCYKRTKYPEQPAALRNWLDRKGMAFLHNSRDFELLFSPKLGEVLVDGFRTLKPVYNFFTITIEQMMRTE